MPKYHFCPVCFAPVRHPQQTTCGGAECRDAWKNMSSATRLKRANLATYSPSERALILAQGPSPEELEEREQRQALLDEQLTEHQSTQNHDARPAFIRDMLSPDNFKPKGGDPVGGTDSKAEEPA